jgi:hypothetical protein
MSDQVTFSEKRRTHRARQLRQARCVFNEGASVLDVTLRNISPTGARIAGHELICLPKTFELRVQDNLGGYSARKARLVWTDGATAGLEFID